MEEKNRMRRIMAATNETCRLCGAKNKGVVYVWALGSYSGFSICAKCSDFISEVANRDEK